MKNEEAKDILLEIKNGALWKLNIQIAFDMAIKALEQKYIIDKDGSIKVLEQPKIKARWIRNSKELSHCSKCNQKIFTCQNWFKFCPCCGAEMEK